MSPLEAAIRAVCAYIGADPESWRGFEDLGRKAIEAFAETLPPELAEAIRRHL